MEPFTASRIGRSMAKRNDIKALSWPWWASWALLAVAVTAVLTVAVTLNDIL